MTILAEKTGNVDYSSNAVKSELYNLIRSNNSIHLVQFAYTPT